MPGALVAAAEEAGGAAADAEVASEVEAPAAEDGVVLDEQADAKSAVTRTAATPPSRKRLRRTETFLHPIRILLGSAARNGIDHPINVVAGWVGDAGRIRKFRCRFLGSV